ncbi:MAG: hypothetical protein JNM69_25885 [Archangium sp.]|nr:hypothetical protein [Archangium sp.]
MKGARRQLVIWLGVAVVLVAIALLLPGDVVFVLAGAAWGLGLAGFVARGRYGKARALLSAKQYEAAFDELLAFEQQVRRDGWRRSLAFLYTGFHTGDPLALARCYQGVVRLEQGRLVEAEALLKGVVELDQAYGLAWANRAIVAASMGDEPSARAHERLARQNGVTGATLARTIAAALSKTTPTN